ncbi:MAG: hypothetical protein JXX14_13205 [Deltaproteobacteria bacterium]|nr:hypothetical protein [Deltaproteobacteria bacterium]
MSQLNVLFTNVVSGVVLMLLFAGNSVQAQSPSESSAQKAAVKASEEAAGAQPSEDVPPVDATPATVAVTDSQATDKAGTEPEAGQTDAASDVSSNAEMDNADADAAAVTEGKQSDGKTGTEDDGAGATTATSADAAASATADQGANVQNVTAVDVLTPPKRPDNFTAKSIPRTDRIVNIHTSQTVRPGAMTLTIDHRAHETFLSGEDAWFDYLGLDSGNLKIGIGLRLGLKDYMDVGFYRLNNGTDLFDAYEFDTKMRFLEQDSGFVNMSLRIGATWFVQKDADDAVGFFSQLNVDRRLFGTLLVGTGFAFHTDSSNDHKKYENVEQSAAVLGYVEWRPVRVFSLNGEMAAAVAGYNSKYPVFAFSARFLTHRHSFQLLVANSQQMSADGIVANAWRGFGHLLFGFQIVREFQLKD